MDNIILSVNGLTKNYKNICAIKNLTLSVERGKIFGLLGPNGAGKSTTIECILRTKKYNKGSVEILGMNMEESKKEICKEIGVQFQADFFPDRIKVGEMCEMMASLYKETVNWKSLLGKFGLGDKIKQDISKLSGGERQKLSVFIALINQPKLVFLDELTTGLDPRARREVWRLLKNLQKEGLTIFLTSHYMDEVEALCDEVLIINNGQSVIVGTPDGIVEKSGMTNLEEAYLYYIGEENEYESI
ncbi:ABC transporter ATP-binding protein [Vallitalea maricola]|uniref:ABC transporter ATP-binding protein n=1 Tax=Vallitalea maricola TaxID=3074433 RepID=A0ACB5UJ63_9FIRM|nr:ABC transporter ATP-binding protein [Vallitalea sp. AN17-2]